MEEDAAPVWRAQRRLEWIPQYRGSSILAGLSVSRAKSGLDPIFAHFRIIVWEGYAVEEILKAL